MEQRFSTQSAGMLLGRVGLAAISIGLILAAWNGMALVATVLGLVVAAAGISWLWSWLSLHRVNCERLLAEDRAFPGEYIELTLKLDNGKILPLPWIQVDDEIPLDFSSEVSTSPEARAGFGYLSKAAAMLWYSSARWKCKLQCNKRGYYRLGPIKVTSGDIFGFYPRSFVRPAPEHVIVYPRIFPVNNLNLPSRYPLGDTRAEKRIFEDPTRIMGIRDYQPSDSLRRIHWKATARYQNLQVKVYEPTTTLDVGIFLAVDSFVQGGSNNDDFELGISMAGSIARHILDLGSPAGLFVNSRLIDSGQPARILPGSSGFQLISILEALAKVTSFTSTPFTDFLQAERHYLPWGTTLIFIVGSLSPAAEVTLANLKQAGYKFRVYRMAGRAEKMADPAAVLTGDDSGGIF